MFVVTMSQGTLIPLPPPLAMAAAGLLGLLGIRTLRRRSSRRSALLLVVVLSALWQADMAYAQACAYDFEFGFEGSGDGELGRGAEGQRTPATRWGDGSFDATTIGSAPRSCEPSACAGDAQEL